MMKKVVTCAVVAVAALALGTGSAAADSSVKSDDREVVAAKRGGGDWDNVRGSSGGGIYSGSKHYGAFLMTDDVDDD
ncbi:hypothetical protein ABZ626_10380 [Streptomyces longispororuber]|uniref:hypothetical protein n=1 Tax=Streptomyces longispororuber TaxID=68230 RepID=UPI0033C2035A